MDDVRKSVKDARIIRDLQKCGVFDQLIDKRLHLSTLCEALAQEVKSWLSGKYGGDGLFVYGVASSVVAHLIAKRAYTLGKLPCVIPMHWLYREEIYDHDIFRDCHTAVITGVTSSVPDSLTTEHRLDVEDRISTLTRTTKKRVVLAGDVSPKEAQGWGAGYLAMLNVEYRLLEAGKFCMDNLEKFSKQGKAGA